MPNSARMAHLAFFHWPNASLSGALEWVPSAFIFRKAGLSANCMRIQTETASSSTETMNGTRQPQSAKSFGPRADWVNRITISDMNRPMVAVV